MYNRPAGTTARPCPSSKAQAKWLISASVCGSFNVVYRNASSDGSTLYRIPCCNRLSFTLLIRFVMLSRVCVMFPCFLVIEHSFQCSSNCLKISSRSWESVVNIYCKKTRKSQIRFRTLQDLTVFNFVPTLIWLGMIREVILVSSSVISAKGIETCSHGLVPHYTFQKATYFY